MIREVNLTEIDSNFMARETQDSPVITARRLQTIKQTLTTSNDQLNLLKVTFLAILK